MVPWLLCLPALLLPGVSTVLKSRVLSRAVDLLHPDYPKLREECPKRADLAFNVAALAHHGQWRANGAVYLSHPVRVARILSELDPCVQTNMLVASVLHDTLEDTFVTTKLLRRIFGSDVSSLVFLCSKPSKLDHTHVDADERRRLDELALIDNMLADWRVAVIKVCDRLHNMRTLRDLDPEKRRRVAAQTYALHMPVAHRLGLFSIKTELGDLAFKELNPCGFQHLQEFVSSHSRQRTRIMGEMRERLARLLRDEGIEGFVQSRLKSLHSIDEKMRKHAFSAPTEVHDVSALRLVVSKDDPDLCYLLMAKIHKLWTPVAGSIKDYIANPKPNGYASLHTVVRFEDFLIEVQIRTDVMHKTAEHGAAAHWSYKTPTYLATFLRELEIDLTSRDIDARFIIEGEISLMTDVLNLVNQTSHALDMIHTRRTTPDSAVFVYDVRLDDDSEFDVLQHSIQRIDGIRHVQAWRDY